MLHAQIQQELYSKTVKLFTSEGERLEEGQIKAKLFYSKSLYAHGTTTPPLGWYPGQLGSSVAEVPAGAADGAADGAAEPAADGAPPADTASQPIDDVSEVYTEIGHVIISKSMNVRLGLVFAGKQDSASCSHSSACVMRAVGNRSWRCGGALERAGVHETRGGGRLCAPSCEMCARVVRRRSVTSM